MEGQLNFNAFAATDTGHGLKAERTKLEAERVTPPVTEDPLARAKSPGRRLLRHLQHIALFHLFGINLSISSRHGFASPRPSLQHRRPPLKGSSQGAIWNSFDNRELGQLIKKLRVEGGYGSSMYSPSISDLFISFDIYSSDDSSGLCDGLPLINPTRVILWEKQGIENMMTGNLAHVLAQAMVRYRAEQDIGQDVEPIAIEPSPNSSFVPMDCASKLVQDSVLEAHLIFCNDHAAAGYGRSEEYSPQISAVTGIKNLQGTSQVHICVHTLRGSRSLDDVVDKQAMIALLAYTTGLVRFCGWIFERNSRSFIEMESDISWDAFEVMAAHAGASLREFSMHIEARQNVLPTVFVGE
ncbi:hypothetical protein FB451DRAFT_1380283 [Mycena latifolia]|nr:hypothetical protein FB451DRAFT_1380283 [Mycena latifolia]